MGTRIATLMCLLGALALPATAQDAEGPLAAIEQLFEGMRTANAEMTRAVLAADARFAMIGRDGSLQARSVDGWVNGIAESNGRWNEQIYDVEIQVDGHMASAWTPYTFYLDGAISHCGINSIELLRGSDGWKITQISDTRRTDECPDPLGGR